MPASTLSEAQQCPMLIGGEWKSRSETISVRNPYDDRLVAEVPAGTVEDVRAAIEAAAVALQSPFHVHHRYDVLMKAASLVEEKQESYARTIALEGSKTIREARREPVRTANLLRLSAEEGRRLTGETLPFESRVGSENRTGYYFRFPVGIIAAITPFNDPLAMAGHNIGPAIAAGNAIILKPSARTPLSVLMLAKDLVDAGLPKGRLSVITGHGAAIGESMVSDQRVRLVTFTGGVETGRQVSRWLGIKKVLMELGSNSPVIVMADAGLEKAVRAISAGAFAQAGENCIGVQRVYVHDDVYDKFREGMVARVKGLKAGSSMDETVDVCAMISTGEAERVEAWIQDAVLRGAKVLVGGKRDGAVVWPTVLEGVSAEAKLSCDEVYGPVVSLYRFSSLDEAIRLANQSEYGLHAAIFTERIDNAFKAIHGLQCGAVMVNDSTDYRLDVMPFGGTKLSGVGRQGIWSMIQEMTETRVVCFNL
ncbi:MAG: aldehyde dehydrogenase family protein [Ignavibacteriales bacterium]|nr:aldehyde dehydrogenase family protein [Ignavibacteriales bacterium]